MRIWGDASPAEDITMLDEKGRLFGKINIIDLLVLLLIVAVAIVVGIKLLGGGGLLSEDTTQGGTITYTVKVSGVDPDVYDAIKGYKGDKLMASGTVIAGSEIVDITSEPHDASVTLDTQPGALQLPLDEGLLDLTFTIKAQVPDVITNEVGTQEVRIGKIHLVKTVHFELTDGVVTSCSWDSGVNG